MKLSIRRSQTAFATRRPKHYYVLTLISTPKRYHLFAITYSLLALLIPGASLLLTGKYKLGLSIPLIGLTPEWTKACYLVFPQYISCIAV
jgi:hypothetical protein